VILRGAGGVGEFILTIISVSAQCMLSLNPFSQIGPFAGGICGVQIIWDWSLRHGLEYSDTIFNIRHCNHLLDISNAAGISHCD